MYNGKYEKLYYYLKNNAKEVSISTLTFEEIEKILQFKLPSSAYKYSAWWANESLGSHSHSRSWMNASWKTSDVKLGDKVTFTKDNSNTYVGRKHGE